MVKRAEGCVPAGPDPRDQRAPERVSKSFFGPAYGRKCNDRGPGDISIPTMYFTAIFSGEGTTAGGLLQGLAARDFNVASGLGPL